MRKKPRIMGDYCALCAFMEKAACGDRATIPSFIKVSLLIVALAFFVSRAN
jgi:hypothetical protein